jgi:hypothetical protein
MPRFSKLKETFTTGTDGTDDVVDVVDVVVQGGWLVSSRLVLVRYTNPL